MLFHSRRFVKLALLAPFLLLSSVDFAEADDNAGIILALAKHGVSIYSMSAAELNPALAKSPSLNSDDPARVQADVKQFADSYRARVREGQATADLTHSLGEVIIKS